MKKKQKKKLNNNYQLKIRQRSIGKIWLKRDESP